MYKYFEKRVGAFRSSIECRLYEEGGNDDKVSIPIVCTCIFVGMSIVRIEYAMTSTLGSLSFAFVICALCEKIEMKNRVLALFGTISWELYLCHTRLLFIGKDRLVDSPLVWFAFSFLESVAVALFFHVALDFILNRNKRIKEKVRRN